MKSRLSSLFGLCTLLSSGMASGVSVGFSDACKASGEMDPTFCECADEVAKSALSDKSYQLLVALFTHDDRTVSRLQQELPLEQSVAASMFLTRARKECPGE